MVIARAALDDIESPLHPPETAMANLSTRHDPNALIPELGSQFDPFQTIAVKAATPKS